MSDPATFQFTATLLGSCLGVVAGVLVQYGFHLTVSKNQRRKQLADIRAEAAYNLQVVEELLRECGKLRAACQPNTLASYFGTFRFNDVLWIAMNRLVTSGDLYSTFTYRELQNIQPCMVFLSANTGQWITNQITQLKNSTDIKGGLSIANYIESECKRHQATVIMLNEKH